MLTTYNTESANIPNKNAKEVYRRVFLLKRIRIWQRTSLTVLRDICSEGITGNQDLRKENALCMPEELILCYENKIKITFWKLIWNLFIFWHIGNFEHCLKLYSGEIFPHQPPKETAALVKYYMTIIRNIFLHWWS